MVCTRDVKKRGNGVIILTKDGYKATPILNKLNVCNICTVMLQKWDRIHKVIYKVIVVGVYVKHGMTNETMADLKFILQNIH